MPSKISTHQVRLECRTSSSIKVSSNTLLAPSGSAATNAGHLNSPVVQGGLTKDQADFFKMLQQRSRSTIYLLPPSVDLPPISSANTADGLSTRLSYMYNNDTDEGRAVVVAGPDKGATIWLHQKVSEGLNGSRNKQEQDWKLSPMWLVIGFVVGAVGIFVALAWF